MSLYSTEQLLALYEDTFSSNHFNQSPTNLYQPVAHIMGMKGKKIRPLLVLMGCQTVGGDVQQALYPAFAMEVFHNSTLVNDDIMDKADVRRGQPAVHKVYGANAAMLAADVMMAYTYKFLANVQPNLLRPLVETFNQTAIEIFEGQQMDMDFETRLDVSPEEYLKMIEFKTSVLLGCCLKTGAIIGGADEAVQQHMYHIGLNLGLSFQLKDDLLDAFGDAAKVGKKSGGDILQNKKTYLLINAFELSNATQRKSLESLLQVTEEENKINSIKQIMHETGAVKATEQKAAYYYETASQQIETLDAPATHKTALKEFAGELCNRVS